MAFREHLPAIMAGTAPRRKQDLSKGSFLRSGFDWNLIDWSRDAKGIRGQIRCFTNTGSPAYTSIGGAKFTINDAELAAPDDLPSAKEDAVPGEVLAITDKGPLVQTGEGQIILTDFAADDAKLPNLALLSASALPLILG